MFEKLAPFWMLWFFLPFFTVSFHCGRPPRDNYHGFCVREAPDLEPPRIAFFLLHCLDQAEAVVVLQCYLPYQGDVDHGAHQLVEEVVVHLTGHVYYCVSEDAVVVRASFRGQVGTFGPLEVIPCQNEDHRSEPIRVQMLFAQESQPITDNRVGASIKPIRVLHILLIQVHYRLRVCLKITGSTMKKDDELFFGVIVLSCCNATCIFQEYRSRHGRRAFPTYSKGATKNGLSPSIRCHIIRPEDRLSVENANRYDQLADGT